MSDNSDDTQIISNFTSTETDVFFGYEVKLSRSEIFDRPIFQNLKNVGEMIITSGLFEEYHDCVQDCYEMLNEFASHIKETDNQFIIATKINPLHDPMHDGSEVTEDWEPEMVLKMYLADAKTLREEQTIKSTISAIVSVQQDVDLRTAKASALIN